MKSNIQEYDIRGSTKSNFAVGLLINSVPLGMYLNYFFSASFFSELLLVLSLLFFISYKKIVSHKINNFGAIFLFIIIFQIICIFYSLLNEAEDYYLTHLYLILLSISMFFSDLKTIDLEKSIKIAFFISCLTSIMGVFVLYANLVVGEEAWELKQNYEYYALEIFTISNGAIINFSCLMFLLARKKLILISLIFAILDFYIISYGGKRSPFMVLIAIFLLWVFFNKNILNEFLFKYFKFYSIVIFLLIFTGFNLSYIQEVFKNIYFGVRILLGDLNVQDSSGSAIMRVEAREWAYSFILSNFDFYKLLFGNGYMTRWLDNPLLQSFLDMGLLGFTAYFFIVIITPLYVFLKSRKNEFYIFSFSLCIYAIITCLNSGNPYLYTKFLPVIVLLFMDYIVRFKRNKSSFDKG